MTVLLAVAVVGAGSLLFRLGPLLGARRLPERAPRLPSDRLPATVTVSGADARLR